jgi:CRP-like cAMP-binding protein
MTERETQARENIIRQGDRSTQCCLVLDGLLARSKVLIDGTRQILSFEIAGDIPDLQSLHLEAMDHELESISPSRIAFIQHTVLRDLLRFHPRLSDILWRETLIDAPISREWLTNVGRRDGVQRLAHLVIEIWLRLKVVGKVNAMSFHLPITQEQLGDAIGLSTVHANRILQSLREKQLLSWDHGQVDILNLDALAELALFDPAYLHLKPALSGFAPKATSRT